MTLGTLDLHLQPVQSTRRTGAQRRETIYQFICHYADEMDGPTPSIHEVAVQLHLDYKVTYYHIMKLIAGGRLRQERGKLVVVGGEWLSPDFVIAQF